MDIRLEKKKLREKVLQKRDSLSKEEWSRKSNQIFKKLVSLEELASARNIFIFINFRSEVNTKPIIEFLLSHNKNVIVPYTDTEKKQLRLFYLNNFSELKIGTYGILEPDSEKAKEAALEDVDLVIMPGSVFDLKGGRIGYGGGFYDRLLPSLRPDVKTIAIAFELQIVDEVPMGYYDRRVNLIVTEDRIIKANG